MQQHQLVGRGLSPPGSDRTGAPEEVLYIPGRTFISATCFLFATGALFFWWLAMPLINTQYFAGYPQLGSALPGAYRSSLYEWNWWAMFMITWNALVPMSFAMALTHNRLKEWANLHKVISLLAMLVNLVAFVMLLVEWIGFCDNGISGGHTNCNNYEYCCYFFGTDWCPNNAACVFPVSLGDLTRNFEASASWYMTIAFGVVAYLNLLYNETLRRDYALLLS